MLVIPAIDLKDGEAVRLYKGDYNKKVVYSSHPEELAAGFEKMGAKYLHVVDLDGAKDAHATNKETIKRIRASISIPMELGGGIRDMDTVSMYLDEIGVDRVILGTAAIKNPAFLDEALKKYGPERIVVGVDVRDRKVSIAGWLETSDVDYLTFIHQLEERGVKYIVCTDISKDGTLTGPSFPLYEEIHADSKINFVVSGGVKDDEDVYEVNKRDYYACIVGKAYYEGRINLKEVIENAG